MATQASRTDGTPEALLAGSAEELYEHAPCGYLCTLPNGTIVKVNQTFLDWTGYRRDELLAGKRFQDLLTIGGKLFHETHYAPLLRLQGFVREINFELVCKQGGSLPTLVNSTQQKDATGRPVLHRTILLSITDRKNYERELLLARKRAEQAEQTSKARMDFLAMVSHEIRTPMNAIVGLSGLLRQTELSSEQQEYVSILQSSSGNLLSLLNNILDLSKIEAGKVALEARHFNVRQLLYGIFYGLTVRAEEKKLHVQVEVDERVPAWLLGDPVKISQVLTNLLANAIKFTEHGTVTLAAQVRESSAESVSVDFKVTDTGIGIPKSHQALIFEEFTQASYDIQQRYGGTGLGLAICQKLLELYGSRLELESTPGEGSSFFFNLRLKTAQGPEAPEVVAATSPPGPQSLQGFRLLVAEDNTVNVFVLSQYLRKWGTRFEVVENGHQAVARIQEAPYDLVLMDLQMPELDGYEATRAIRALPEERFRRLPILAMTASTRIGLEERVAAAGFTDFVCKPFKPEELFAKIALRGSQPQAVPAGSPVPVEPVRAPPALASVASPPRFRLEDFRAMAEGDPEALREFTTITITSAEQHKHAFQNALETGNLEEFDFQAHKIKMTVALLHAQALQTAVQRGRALLASEASDPASLHAAVHSIQEELDVIIRALKDDLRAEASK